MPTAVLVGTMDTKGHEYEFLRDQIRANGVDVLIMDVGILGAPTLAADISREKVAGRAGTSLDALLERNDRGEAITAMASGAAAYLKELWESGELQAVAGIGGSGGSSLIAHGMRALPIGVPKLLVSTVASGDTRPYVGETDITMMYSVTDIAGLNDISRQILSNAAGAIAGLATASRQERHGGKLIAASMFGVTTPCVDTARKYLEDLGYEVLVFHATGSGGRALETLVRDGFVAGVLDVTLTEIADEIAGGIWSAGPSRLKGAGAMGIPQVVSLGALDMVNFGPVETVPSKYSDRNLYQHNANVTLMRTTPEECRRIGETVAGRLNAAQGPVILFVPTKGISMLSKPGSVFYDSEADKALIEALYSNLQTNVQVIEMDTDINDAEFALAMAKSLHSAYETLTSSTTQEDK